MTRHLVVLLAVLCLAGCGSPRPRVVLYCAQDREFAEETLAEFTRRTGIDVVPKYDTEADKSVSLYLELLQERGRPRCDVFWNNEILSTLRGRRQGLWQSYASPSAAPYPAWARPEDGTWHAFAERARVLVVNTRLVPEAERPRGLFDLLDPKWRGRVALARPRFGTSATMAACLYAALGPDEARRFYRGLRDNAAQVVPGNKQAAEWVGEDRAAVGLTDTDDALAEVRAGRPVAVVFPDRDGCGTLFIPNTLAVVRGGPNATGARQLVDYLLSAEVEEQLARSHSAQMPLNPLVKVELPAALGDVTKVKRLAVDFEKAAEHWDAAQRELAELF